METAGEMLACVMAALPADVAVFAAAVADWRVAEAAPLKLKKTEGGAPPRIALTPNPDILATVSRPGPLRPRLVVGFAGGDERFDRACRGEAAAQGLRLDCGQ